MGPNYGECNHIFENDRKVVCYFLRFPLYAFLIFFTSLFSEFHTNCRVRAYHLFILHFHTLSLIPFAGTIQIDELEVELYLARLESLMDQRPLLLNSVLLRQNPHNVADWLKRVELLKPRGAREQISAFMEAITAVDPGKQLVVHKRPFKSVYKLTNAIYMYLIINIIVAFLLKRGL